MNHTYRAGEEVIRVSVPDLQVSLTSVTDALGDAGVIHARPTGRLQDVGEWEVTTWEFCEPQADEVDFAAFGASIRRLHDLDRSVFADLEPIRSCTTFPHLDLEPHLAAVAPHLDPRARTGLEAELVDLAAWRDEVAAAPRVVAHGDVHFNNVIPPATIIDWDMLCEAPRAWDHAPMISAIGRWGVPPEAYAAFAAGYGADLRSDPLAQRLARLRDLAATIMLAVRVVGGSATIAAAAELENRLSSWRGTPDPPPWNAQ